MNMVPKLNSCFVCFLVYQAADVSFKSIINEFLFCYSPDNIIFRKVTAINKWSRNINYSFSIFKDWMQFVYKENYLWTLNLIRKLRDIYFTFIASWNLIVQLKC